MREERVRIDCGGIDLDGALVPGEPGASRPGIVLCHPHPAYGGTMDDAVGVAVRDAVANEGMSVLRFDFRGTRASGGESAGGEREEADVHAALELLAARGARPLAVVGYRIPRLR